MKNMKSWGLWLFAFIVLLPLVVLCFFNHPVGVHDWDWMIQFGYPDLPFLEYQKLHYETFSGRFFSTFILSLTPYCFSFLTFKFFPIVLLLLLYFSLCFLGNSFSQSGYKLATHRFALLFLVLYVVGLSGIFELVYTVSSGFLYLDTCILSMVWLGLLARVHTTPKTVELGFLGLLTIMINGSNEINLFILNIVLILYGLHRLRYQRKVPIWLLVIGLVSIGSALVAVLAPANFNRIEGYEGSGNLLFAFAFGLPAMAQNILSWVVNTPLVLVSLLVWQPLQQAIEKIQHPILYRKNMPWLITGLFATQFLPLVLLLYASGPNSLPERVIDVLYLHFLLAWFLILASYIKNYTPAFSFKLPLAVQTGLSIVILLFILFNPLKINRDLATPKQLNFSTIVNYIDIDNNIGKAYLTLLDGSAQSYSAANYKMYEELKSCTSDSCYVQAFERYPTIIYEKVFDRKDRKNGDKYMMYYLDGRAARVFYKK